MGISVFCVLVQSCIISRFSPLRGKKMCVKMRSSSGKEKRLMTQFFANAAASHFAQAACAAFSCSDMNSMIILDASLILLASFIMTVLSYTVIGGIFA